MCFFVILLYCVRVVYAAFYREINCMLHQNGIQLHAYRISLRVNFIVILIVFLSR